MNDKPRHRSGYTAEETELVRSACLTVAVTLGTYLSDVVVVGGLVPSLLIDSQPTTVDGNGESHPGTNDLDLGLSLALLEEQRYTEISTRLRSEGFEPDVNKAGNRTVQRWRLSELKVDFLMPPAPGLELAFEERFDVKITGRTLKGERAERTLPVCGTPGAAGLSVGLFATNVAMARLLRRD